MDFNKIRKEFYEGKLSQAGAQDFLDFLESQEAEELMSEEIIQRWSDHIKAGDLYRDNSELWRRIALKKESSPKPSLQKETSIRTMTRPIWLRAAVVLLFLGLTSLFFIRYTHEADLNEDPAIQEVFISNSNPKGEKTKVTLEDGSVVYLNSLSSITYPENFKNNRYIQLEGEAYFEVAKDPEHPFRVEAEGVVTTALGTSFNISTFMAKEKVAVTLLTGKVKLNQYDRDAYLELSPGEESLISRDTPQMEKYKVNAADRVLWIEGILKFEEARLEEMVEVLERWYGVTINVNGKPKALSASGIFDNQESLRNVLTVMGKSLGFEFVMDDKMITLNFN